MSILRSRIRDRDVSVILPTMNRRLHLLKCVETLRKNCSLTRLRLVVVDSTPSTGDRVQLSELEEFGFHRAVLIRSRPRGVGAARAVGVDWSMKRPKIRNMVFLEDDAFVGPDCLERLLAVQMQEPKFGYVGVVGGYVRFWKDRGWSENQIRYYSNLGVCWTFSREFVKKVGNFDPSLVMREDAEMGFRAWDNGFMVGAVLAPIRHSRSGESFKQGTPLWMESARQVESKYPELVKATSHGCLRPRFKYPEKPYTIDFKTLKLTVPR